MDISTSSALSLRRVHIHGNHHQHFGRAKPPKQNQNKGTEDTLYESEELDGLK